MIYSDNNPDIGRRVWIAFISVLTILIAAFPAHAKTGFAPDISQYELSNGIALVVIPDRRAPVVTHTIWYKVGSADDPVGKSGLAHFVEHLMFKETKNYGPGEFSSAIAAIGGQENAFTTPDYTAYYQKVAPSALGQMMAFESDRMKNLVLDEQAFLSEREVILEERSSRVDANPGSILSEAVRATMFKHHPYGRPVIGWEHEIRNLTRQDALDFYKKWYQPWNATVIVAGDVNASDVLQLAEQTYGRLETTSPEIERQRLQEPPPVTARQVTYSDPRTTKPQWSRRYLAPTYSDETMEEAIAMDLLGEILGGSRTSRLRSSLVFEKNLATSAGAYFDGSAMDNGVFMIYGSPRDGAGIEELETAIEAEISRVREHGVTQDELDKAKQNFIKSLVFSQDSQVSLMRIIGSILSTGGDVEDFTEYPSKLEAVSIEAVNRVAREYLANERAVTSYLLPEEKT